MTDRTGVGLILLSAGGFATLGIFGKLAATAGLSIPTVLAFRFLLASVVVWGMFGVVGSIGGGGAGGRRYLTGRTLLVALGLGSVGYAAVSGLYFWGLAYLTAGLVGIVFYTYPVFVVVFAVLFLDETVTRRTAAALTLALAGVSLVMGADTAGADPVGVGLVLAAAVVYAGYITVGRTTLSTVDSRTLTAHVVPATAASFFLYGGATGTLSVPATLTEWGILVGLAVVATALPMFTFFAGLARLGASRASIVSTVEPAMTVSLGAVVLSESVTPMTVTGGALVVVGVLLVESE
jgi:drug/metabolite transporter (DMT)-like permease